MDSRINDQYTELPSVETPEDVAVLYSWANLHGAKYRDFSASRREYRAQLRHRAAEQARETELRAQADAEAAAEQARRSGEVRLSSGTEGGVRRTQTDSAVSRASADRTEQERRAIAAEAAMQREMREIAEMSGSERRKVAMQAEPETRRRVAEARAEDDEILPGKISDPYTPELRQAATEREQLAEPAIELRPQRLRVERPLSSGGSGLERQGLVGREVPSSPERVPSRESHVPRMEERPVLRPVESAPPALPTASGARRPQGYRPDDASGVRQIYRAPEAPARAEDGSAARRREDKESRGIRESAAAAGRAVPSAGRREGGSSPVEPRDVGRLWTGGTPAVTRPGTGQKVERREQRQEPAVPTRDGEAALTGEESTPRRRRQDQTGYRMTDSDRAIAAYRLEQGRSGDTSQVAPRACSSMPVNAGEASGTEMQATGQAAVPAWLHGQEAVKAAGDERVIDEPRPIGSDEAEDAWGVGVATGADTLQRSRERVASRWYALKGVFEQPGQERVEAQPVRQKETRTPVLAVFSFAGGVGKTSLVATLGRSLSSLGEKVLLTDTTSHGLLPFYFGASELREGTVRTFSPPSGSTDAPIYLVNYAMDQTVADEAEQTRVAEEIANSSRGSHRVLLDLTSSTGWILRRVAYMNPTVLVPLAPDMNSVISLQAIEKFLLGINGPDGTPVKVFYVLTQFDASQPLHLDVREVLRRQLGDRLLPMVIRRTPAVSEALAEGMTIVDYAADAPATEDYMNVAGWLRTIAAPATAGFRNVRWSER